MRRGGAPETAATMKAPGREPANFSLSFSKIKAGGAGRVAAPGREGMN